MLTLLILLLFLLFFHGALPVWILAVWFIEAFWLGRSFFRRM